FLRHPYDDLLFHLFTNTSRTALMFSLYQQFLCLTMSIQNLFQMRRTSHCGLLTAADPAYPVIPDCRMSERKFSFFIIYSHLALSLLNSASMYVSFADRYASLS